MDVSALWISLFSIKKSLCHKHCTINDIPCITVKAEDVKKLATVVNAIATEKQKAQKVQIK